MRARRLKRLTRLNELRLLGALTDTEFDAEKRKLFSERAFPLATVVGASLVAIVGVVGYLRTVRGSLPSLPARRDEAAGQRRRHHGPEAAKTGLSE